MSSTVYEESDRCKDAASEECIHARLAWANGALAFVNGPHAWKLREVVKHYPGSEGVDKPWIMAQDDEGRSELLKQKSHKNELRIE